MTDPLSALVRDGKLSSPVRRDFDRRAWDDALAAQPASVSTQSFFDTMMWFGRELAAAHAKVAKLHLNRFDRDALIRELCGRTNYAFTYAEARLKLEATQAEPGDLPMGSPAHVLFTTHAGDIGNADSLRTGVTDTLGTALRHVAANCGTRRGPPLGVAKAAEAAFALFNELYVLEFYCDKAIWQDWRVEREDEAWRLATPEPDQFGRSAIAVDWRRDQDHGEWTFVAGSAWREGRGLGELVAARDPVTKAWQPRWHAPGEGDISSHSVLRWVVEASDLVDVLHKPLPYFAQSRTTLGDLIDGALLMGSAAKVLSDELLLDGPARPFKDFAPAFTRTDLHQILAALGWSAGKRDAVIHFFGFGGAAVDGLWSKPLVPAKGGWIPVFPAIVSPNLYRSAELWLADAGGDQLQKERGAAFELRARKALIDAIGETGLDGEVHVAPSFDVKIDGAKRDVDLTLRIGDTIFIGEDKLKRFPAMPRESRRWIDELAKGAKQARLRCDYFRGTPKRIAELTGHVGDARSLRFVPFVLTSGSFGAGVEVDGVPVVDFEGFREFFAPGYYGTMGELRAGSNIVAHKTVPFRDETLGLVACFEAYLKNPVRVRAIEAALVPLARTIGMTASDGRAIRVTDQMVDHRRFVVSAADALQATAEEIWKNALARVRPSI
jgi:hypothetical protein